MKAPRAKTADGTRPVIYAGRFAEEVASAGLPKDCRVLGDRDVRPSRLAGYLEDAAALVVLDLFSFPFESMTEAQRDVPLVAVLPPGFDAGFLRAVFGTAVFATLGPFDRVATADPSVWEDLRRAYRWTESQRIELEEDGPDAAARACARLLVEEAAGPPPGKAVHRTQEWALAPQVAAARGVRDADVPFDVLEVGISSARWASGLDPATTRFAGLDLTGRTSKTLYAASPAARLDVAGEDLTFPYDPEVFDLTFAVSVLHHHDEERKRTLVSEMWRVARPGGRLAFLEDFVAERGDGPAHVVSVPSFVGLVVEATAGGVVLEHFEALRYPRDPFFRGGLMVLSKVGTPRAW